MSDPRYFYEQFAEEFDTRVNVYDLEKRLRIVFGELLQPAEVVGRTLLDAGCGTGWFSANACEWGARVTSLDVGERLLSEVAKKCDSDRIVGSILELPFRDQAFDIVVCSEVIEHTVDPPRALKELQRVLRTGGILALTTPNRLWKFAIYVANALKVRPYEGLENWISWLSMRKHMEELTLEIECMFGFHIVPFVSSKLYGFLDCMDHYGEKLGPVMLNMAVRARKYNVYKALRADL